LDTDAANAAPALTPVCTSDGVPLAALDEFDISLTLPDD